MTIHKAEEKTKKKKTFGLHNYSKRFVKVIFLLLLETVFEFPKHRILDYITHNNPVKITFLQQLATTGFWVINY